MVRLSIKSVSTAAAAVLLTSCSPGYPGPLLWHKFRGHDEAQLLPAAQEAGCPQVGVQNLTAEEREILLAARAEVCRVIATKAFADEVKGRTWLATCNGSKRNPDIVSGEEAYRLYTSNVGAFSVRFRKPWNAEAVTQIAARRMAIRRSRLAAWRVQNGSGRGELINTLAHEMTHMVPAMDPNEIFRFQDADHRERPPGAVELVSYGFGEIVEKLAARSSGRAYTPPKMVESC